MKFYLSLIFTAFSSCFILGQTIWSENFNNSCTAGCFASSYNGPNGTWSVTSTGTNGSFANDWFVSGAECGLPAGQCGAACGATNSSLHIGSNVVFMGNPLIVDPGAAYLSGGAALGGDATTNKRVESPIINTTGFNSVSVSFNYMENGQAAFDNAQLWVFDGTTWSLLSDMPKTLCCGGVPCTGAVQGLWTAFTFNLPGSTFNNPNVRIGFLWTNNDDDLGTDPSVAIDDLVIQGTAIGGGGSAPVADFVFAPNSTCIGQNVVFTDATTNNIGATYSWNFGVNATPQTANTPGPHNVTFSTLGNQTISLTVTNANGTSTATETFNVTSGPIIVATASPTQICQGGSTLLSASGALGGYSWTWNGNPSVIGQNQTVSPTTTTTYTVNGFDAQGCSGSASVTVTVSGQGPTLTMSSIDAVCAGTSTGQASVVAVGNAPYTYSWAPIGGNLPTAGNLFPGNYTVSVTDGNNCTSTGSITVGSPLPIQANAQIIGTDCTQNTGSITVNPTGGNGNYSFLWLPGNSQAPILPNLAAGNYQVTITDGNNCSQQFNFTVAFNNQFLVTIDPSASNISYGDNVQLTSTVTPAITGATYSWSPTQGLSCTSCPNPVATPSSSTTYTLTVTRPNGCFQTSQAQITVDLPCGTVFMPSVFSPNGDFLNDRLCVLGACVDFVTYTIYNRWGEEVFTSRNQNECWNGTFRGKPAPNGVYAFKYQVTLTDGSLVEDSGTVTLVR